MWVETAINFLALSGTAARLEVQAEKLRKFVVLGKEFPALLESRSQSPEARLELACFYEGSPTELGGDSRKIVDESATHVSVAHAPENSTPSIKAWANSKARTIPTSGGLPDN